MFVSTFLEKLRLHRSASLRGPRTILLACVLLTGFKRVGRYSYIIFIKTLEIVVGVFFLILYYYSYYDISLSIKKCKLYFYESIL